VPVTTRALLNAGSSWREAVTTVSAGLRVPASVSASTPPSSCAGLTPRGSPGSAPTGARSWAEARSPITPHATHSAHRSNTRPGARRGPAFVRAGIPLPAFDPQHMEALSLSRTKTTPLEFVSPSSEHVLPVPLGDSRRSCEHEVFWGAQAFIIVAGSSDAPHRRRARKPAQRLAPSRPAPAAGCAVNSLATVATSSKASACPVEKVRPMRPQFV
jgi:hypothetical protein